MLSGLALHKTDRREWNTVRELYMIMMYEFCELAVREYNVERRATGSRLGDDPQCGPEKSVAHPAAGF